MADAVMTSGTVLFGDTVKVLSGLKSKNVNTAIVTGKYHYRIDEILEKFGIQDLIDYIKSTISMGFCSGQELDEIFEYFEAIRKRSGAIHIPKEAGLFISSK